VRVPGQAERSPARGNPKRGAGARAGVRRHERIAVVRRRDEGFLDRTGADPADQVPHRAGLVVRAGRAGPAERLLADDRAGRLVVHVEVPGGVAQLLLRQLDRVAFAREHGAGETVGRSLVDEVQRLAVFRLGVDERGNDGAEQLLLHRAEVRILRLDHGRLDEEAFRVVVAAPDQHARLRSRLCFLDRLLLRAEGACVDHGAHEVLEVGRIAHLDRADLLDEALPDLRPQVRRSEDPRRSRAFLPLILEAASDDRRRDRFGIGGGVGDDEILAAGLADDPRVVAVLRDVVADRLPDRLEDGRRAGEVDAGQVGAREGGIADLRARAVDEVDHSGREAGLLEQPHQEVRRVSRGRGRLPEDGVAHQRGAAGQVGGDRREVEGGHGEDETLERPVLHPVPRSGRRARLLVVDPQHELDVEAQEVDHLARRVDLRLMRRLRLAEHRRGVERRAPRPGEQLRGAKENGGALLPRRAVPVLPRGGGGLDRLLDVAGRALVDGGEDMILVVRHHRVEGLARAHLFAADDERQLDLLGPHLLEPEPQALALRRPRCVRPDRLVLGRGRAEETCSTHQQ
jgi:hypothetical protein